MHCIFDAAYCEREYSGKDKEFVTFTELENSEVFR
jgi:hypothetical protein